MRNCFIILLVALIFNSCKNDLEINANWIETPVVYGFIDAYADTQYIRVEKTYQNSVDMSTKAGAQIADSLYFDSTLQVKVIHYNYLKFDTLTFKRVALQKQDGIFQSGTNYIYQYVYKPGKGSINDLYWLYIYNPKSGKTYVSDKTSLVDSTSFPKIENSVNFTSPDQQGNIGSFYYHTVLGQNAKIYDLFVRMNYIEHYADNTQSSKYIDYFFQKNWVIDASTTDFINNVFKARAYIDYLTSNLPATDNVISRTYVNMQYYASGGASELAYLTALSQPSGTIVPKNTQHFIKNTYAANEPKALGIFSSLSIHAITPTFPSGSDASLKIALKQVPLF